MKKYIILLLIIFSVLTLTACGYSEHEMQEAVNAAYAEGYEDGFIDGKEDGYDTGYDDGYKKGYNALKPVAMPKSGEILSGEETKWRSEITVTASYGSSHVVSVKTQDGTECVTFFVRSGDTVTIGVPSKKLYVYFASGSTWYGYGQNLMFGEETSYSKDDEPLDFSKYTISYTLHPVQNGNLQETPCNPWEFF